MIKQRNRTKQTVPLQERLASFADRAVQRADGLSPGPRREQMIKKARLAKIADDIDKWASSPGLQPPE